MPYIEALQKAGFEVILHEDAEGGLKYLRANASALGLVILDYMMPTPKGVSPADTLDGFATGRWLLREGRDLIEGCELPVIVLTNRKVETVQIEIGEFTLMPMGQLIRVRHKTHTHRNRLAGIVRQILDG